VWGLQQAGIEAVIAPSYGEIFYFNAGNNRLLLVTLAPEIVDALVAELAGADSKQLSIDVENEVVVTASGERHSFSIPSRQKRMFMDGLDMVQMTLQQSDQIDAFEKRHWAANPWARIDLPAQQRSTS
jgi:3-isopropylmalate/(R)-2-methylmalate dehydratase small subunit